MAQTLPQDLSDYLICCPDGVTLLSISCSGTDESISGLNDGTAEVVVLTGAAPYTYLWSNSETTASITGLGPGIYTVTVTDSQGHEKECSYEVLTGVIATPKYLYMGETPIGASTDELETLYPGTTQDSSTIESAFGVGVAGMKGVNIAYGNTVEYLNELIYVDVTSSTTFWNDIIGWLFLNNFYDITYDVGLDKWLINDPSGTTYIEIIIPCTSYRLTETGGGASYEYIDCDGIHHPSVGMSPFQVVVICSSNLISANGAITVENLGTC